MASDSPTLVVDTDRAILALLSSALESLGFAVTAVPEFDQAVELLKDHAFTGLVVAHRLGAHNGLHLVLRARHDRPAMTVIVTTPADDPILQEEAAAFGAVCLVAPWNDPSTLALALRSSVQPL